MKKFPLVISFYTEKTYYEWEVTGLIDSCKKWEIEHHIVGVPSRGSWEMNCAFKPFFIYEMLKTFKRPLFWVDADAVFLKAPSYLSMFSSDLSVRFNEDLGPSSDSYLLSGSLFVNYTPGGEKVIRLWAEECIRQLSDQERTHEFWDQIALKNILEQKGHGITVAPLPAEYTKVHGRPFDDLYVPDGVIQHNQASRRYKGSILSAGQTKT